MTKSLLSIMTAGVGIGILAALLEAHTANWRRRRRMDAFLRDFMTVDEFMQRVYAAPAQPLTCDAAPTAAAAPATSDATEAPADTRLDAA